MNKRFVVFLSERNNTKVVDIDTAYHPQHQHLKQFMENVMFQDKEELVLKWGDYMYRPLYVNETIIVKNDYYQVVDLKLFGHYFIEETSEDSGKTFEEIDFSVTYLSYEECYNAMKLEAMQWLAANIDIEQDFEFGENNIHKFIVEFSENSVLIKWNENNIKRFRISQ